MEHKNLFFYFYISATFWNKLWEAIAKQYEYKVENNHLYKKLNDGEWEEIC